MGLRSYRSFFIIIFTRGSAAPDVPVDSWARTRRKRNRCLCLGVSAAAQTHVHLCREVIRCVQHSPGQEGKIKGCTDEAVAARELKT